jgi:hypothetical protein
MTRCTIWARKNMQEIQLTSMSDYSKVVRDSDGWFLWSNIYLVVNGSF